MKSRLTSVDVVSSANNYLLICCSVCSNLCKLIIIVIIIVIIIIIIIIIIFIEMPFSYKIWFSKRISYVNSISPVHPRKLKNLLKKVISVNQQMSLQAHVQACHTQITSQEVKVNSGDAFFY